MTAMELDVDRELFRGLSASLHGAHGPLSPWKGVSRTLTPQLRGRLKELGALDLDPAGAPLRSTVAAIAAATGTTTVSLAATGVLVAYIAYAAAGHDTVALSATAEEGTFRLTDPAPTDELVDLVAGTIGRSPIRGMDLSLDLPIDDAFVLAALVDMQRRNALSDLVNGDVAAIRPVELERLRAFLTEPARRGLWLVDAVAMACGEDPSRAAAGVEDSVSRLVMADAVAATPTTAVPAGPWAGSACHFLLLTTALELRNSRQDDTGSIRNLGFVCVQATVTDLMTIEWVEHGIHIETVTADTVVGYVERLLGHPDTAGSTRTEPAAVPAPEVVGAAAVAAPAWNPTHRVPGGGLSAWAAPDPAREPVARIDPGVELGLLERSGDWAHIVCSNGWSAWVDARAMEELPG
ncbi:hypothetical protein [Streptomyces collinus]|uniref:hypothetical protein n=1 Tax=Streptomyces collinus TaxID=42684 RepID=UPI0029434596|nr:hypothetical protein [Streptomyces collinus]